MPKRKCEPRPGVPGFTGEVDVFHDKVAVVFEHGWTHADGDVVFGLFDPTAREIRVSAGDDDRVKATTLHEYLHACIAVMHGQDAVKDEDDAEEMCVRACEIGLVHLSRMPENKWLFDYLFGEGL